MPPEYKRLALKRLFLGRGNDNIIVPIFINGKSADDVSWCRSVNNTVHAYKFIVL